MVIHNLSTKLLTYVDKYLRKGMKETIIYSIRYINKDLIELKERILYNKI